MTNKEERKYKKKLMETYLKGTPKVCFNCGMEGVTLLNHGYKKVCAYCKEFGQLGEPVGGKKRKAKKKNRNSRKSIKNMSPKTM